MSTVSGQSQKLITDSGTALMPSPHLQTPVGADLCVRPWRRTQVRPYKNLGWVGGRCNTIEPSKDYFVILSAAKNLSFKTAEIRNEPE